MLERLNYFWRLFATATAFTFFGIGGVLIPLIAAPILLLFYRNPEQRQRRARWLIQRVFSLFMHYMRFVGIMDWRYKGLERLQRPGALILANHPTLIDVVCLVSLVPNANCIVKGELMRNPAMRGFVSMSGFIVNDGGESLVERAAACLDSGNSLIIFPEGTRTRVGEPLVFQRGAAHIALRAAVGPTPVIIECNPDTLSKQHKWYDIPPSRFRISVDVLDDLPLESYRDLPTSQAARRLTRYLQQFFTEELASHGTDGT